MDRQTWSNSIYYACIASHGNNKCSAVAEMGDCLATIDMGQKSWGRGAVLPFWAVGTGSPSNIMWPGPRPTFVPNGISIHPAVLPQQTWDKNSIGEVAVPHGGGAGSASNTMLSGPRTTFRSSGILIHPVIWPQ